jgi:hypothetical protein
MRMGRFAALMLVLGGGLTAASLLMAGCGRGLWFVCGHNAMGSFSVTTAICWLLLGGAVWRLMRREKQT